MFLVGATGQFLTLALTVLLPFVFLISGHRHVEVENSIASLHVDHETLVINIDYKSCDYYAFNKSIIQDSRIKFRCLSFKKIPPENSKLIQNLVCLDSSGNKAPPFVI